MDQTQTKIIRIVIDSSKAVDGSAEVTRAMKRMEEQAAAATGTLGRIEKALGSLGATVKANLLLQLEQFGMRLLDMAKSSLESAAALDKLAEQLGITAQYLQALQFTAVQNNVGLDKLEAGVAKFTAKMGEAANGSKDVIEALNRLGVKNLDLQGHLRPTADLMQEVAQKIVAIKDPAQQATAAIDFFGKSGQRMLPIMGDIADGVDLMTARMRAAGAEVLPETIKRLDEMDGALERSKLRWRAFVSNGLVALTDWYDRNRGLFAALTMGLSTLVEAMARDPQGMVNAITNAWDRMGVAIGDAIDTGRTAFDDLAIGAGKAATMMLEAFRAIPDQLGKLFVDGMNAALDALSRGLSKITQALEQHVPWLGIKGTSVNLGQLGGGGASITDLGDRIRKAGANYEAGAQAGRRDYAGERKTQRDIAFAEWFAQQEAAATGRDTPASKGAATSTAKGDGSETTADRINKLRESLQAAADAQDAMTAAALRGEQAFQDQEIKAKSLQEALHAYGAKAKATDQNVQDLAKSIEDLNRRIIQGKAAESFALGTTELRNQNEVLRAQITTLNEVPDIQARILASVKAEQEARKGGKAVTDDMRAARRQEIEDNERLKAQLEQMRKAEELWSAPFKQALQNIQTTAADAWEKILDGGEFSFQTLGEAFSKTLKRMAAELLALATIRPVMSVVVQGLGDIGLVSPGMASRLGFPMDSGAGGGAGIGGGGSFGGGIGGGGGLSGLFGSGSSGGWFDFLQKPIIPANYGGAGSYGSIDQLLAQGSPAGLGGMTWGQGIAGIGSIGMGAYTLANSKGTGSTIAGIGQMVGGVMSMIPGLGPIGMGISMVSSLLGGLFGNEEPPIPPVKRPQFGTSAISFNGISFSTSSGNQDGGPNVDKQGNAVGSTVMRLQRLAGLQGVEGSMYGGVLLSGTHYNALDPKTRQWIAENYTQSQLLTPGGGVEAVNYEDTTRNIQQQAEALIAAIFKANATRGGYSNVSESLKAGLNTMKPESADDIQRVIELSKAYDQLGKAANPVKDSIDKINQSLGDLIDFASQAGLSLDPVNAEIKKQAQRTAQDFIDGMLDPLAAQLRALDDERKAALESAQYIKDNIEGVYVDLDKISAYYTKKESDLRKSFYAEQIQQAQSLADFIKRLTYGDLSGASPITTLSGTRGTYAATLAQAQAGNSDAINRLTGDAQAYIQAARGYYGNTDEYARIVAEVRAALADEQSLLEGAGTGGTSAVSLEAANSVLESNAAVSSQMAELIRTIQQQQDQLAQLTAQYQRLAANTRAA